jgi:hypothetical protein
MTVKLDSVHRLLAVFLLLSLAAATHSQAALALAPAQAQALVQRALATESRSAQDVDHLNHPMRYRLRKSSPRLTSTKEIIETRDGYVARLLAINDQPLSQTDEQKEKDRLDGLLSDPRRQQHRKQSEEQDTSIILKVLHMLPQAFIYEYAGPGQGSSGKVEKYRFRPNPRFSPPDLETQALTAMTGEIWVDAAQERVTRLEGHLQQDTNYGWGVLGRLDKGGWIILDQADVDGRQWRIVRFQMKMSLRVLFKNKYFDSVQEMTQYAPVPAGMDYRQAIQMLRSAPGGR